MSLAAKIKEKFPELTDKDFCFMEGTILLQDDSDGHGAYIAKWEHPTIAQPSDAELGITRKNAETEAPAE